MARVDKKTGGRGRHKTGGGGYGLEQLLAEAKDYMEVGKYGKAASALKKLLSDHPDHWEALRLSATLNLKLGSLFAARSSFESLARTALERQDYLLAQSLLKEYLAVVPRYIPFLELVGRAMEGSGNTNGALVEYGKALSFIQESDDAEQKERGPQIYQRVKTLDPNGPITKRLAEVYEPLIGSNGQAAAESPPPDAERRWESQGEPAPFPWEVSQASASEPGKASATATAEAGPPADSAVGTEVDREQSISSSTTTPGESPSEDISVGADTAAPALQEASAAQPPVQETSQDDAFAQAPDVATEAAAAEAVGGDPVGEPPVAAEAAPVEEPAAHLGENQGEAAAAPPAPPPIEEPPPEPKSKSFFGFRFAVGSTQALEDTEGTAQAEEVAAEPASAEESAEAQVSGFTQPSEHVAPEPPPLWEPEPEPEPTMALSLEHEPDVGPAEPTPRQKRSRRSAADKGAPTAPTWAAPSAVGDSKAVPPVRLFPTAAKLHFKATVFMRRVFSAVRSLTLLTLGLVTGCGVLGLLAVAGLTLLWVGTEEKPSNAFYNLMKVPTPPLLDRRQNGYLKLMAIGASSSSNPVLMGERRVVASGDPSQWPEGFADLAAALSAWYGSWDPAEEFRNQRTVIRQWSAFFGALMAKYHGWVGSRIEDVGYGTVQAPDEALILGVHRLYVAEGFSRGVGRGLERLQQDAETWRKALEEAKTLRFKLLAIEALNDDLIVMSGLLSRPDLDPKRLPTMARMSRALDHPERSLRWPMQSQFGLEMEMAKTYLRSWGEEDPRPSYITALTFLPLPKQKVFNAHANYYEALAKHDSLIKVEGDPRRNMPLRYKYTSAPPKTLSDYIVNPIDNLLVKEDRVDWHDVIGRMVELEARLRLGSLQVRIRRPPATSEPLTRVADAGQAYYDPFTGFTMLMDGSKTILYSVGRDGHDNDGDRTLDVSVPLFPQGP